MGPRPKPLEDRFWSRVEKTDTCWLWRGQQSSGYGHIYVHETRERVGTHRLAWELLRGPIPKGFHVDHLCRVPLCCNPDHLEPVTPGENQRRHWATPGVKHPRAGKTHCVHGHELTPDNTYVYPYAGRSGTYRQCRTCCIRRAREQKARRREARRQAQHPTPA